MATTNAGSNSGAVKEAILQHCEEIGKIEGKGQTARMTLAEYITARAQDKEIDVDDAEQVWTRMMVGSSSETDEVGGNEATLASRAGDIKNFIMLGRNGYLDGIALLDNAKQRMIKIRASREDGKKGRVWTMMLAFARAQNDSAERALSNKEIDKLFEQKIAEDREKVDILWGARNSMLKANEGVEDRKIQDAIDLCDQRIAEMGGTRKQRKAAVKAAERAAKIAKGEKVAPVRKVKRK